MRINPFRNPLPLRRVAVALHALFLVCSPPTMLLWIVCLIGSREPSLTSVGGLMFLFGMFMAATRVGVKKVKVPNNDPWAVRIRKIILGYTYVGDTGIAALPPAEVPAQTNGSLPSGH